MIQNFLVLQVPHRNVKRVFELLYTNEFYEVVRLREWAFVILQIDKNYKSPFLLHPFDC